MGVGSLETHRYRAQGRCLLEVSFGIENRPKRHLNWKVLEFDGNFVGSSDCALKFVVVICGSALQGTACL